MRGNRWLMNTVDEVINKSHKHYSVVDVSGHIGKVYVNDWMQDTAERGAISNLYGLQKV